MVYRVKIKVRFGDIDHAGILYYPRFFHYFHIAFEEFFEQVVGVSYDRILNDERIAFPTVKLETEFRKPLEYGDILEVAMESRQVGNASATFGFTVYKAGTPEVCARSQHTVVCVGTETFRPTPIPARCREAFESIAAPARA
jgi:4-hydroxybenzoyl-CoA thioesterase